MQTPVARLAAVLDVLEAPVVLSLSGQLTIYLCVEPTDMPKGFDTLAAVVR